MGEEDILDGRRRRGREILEIIDDDKNGGYKKKRTVGSEQKELESSGIRDLQNIL